MSKSRTIAAIVIVSVLGGCGTTQETAETGEESANAIRQTGCDYFEEMHKEYWQAYNEPEPPPLTPEEVAERVRESNERLAAQGSDLRYDPETGLPVGTIPGPYATDPSFIRDRLQGKGLAASFDIAVRNWPLVRDDTLQYLMREMAETNSAYVFQRNFTSASSYCDLPDQPTASK